MSMITEQIKKLRERAKGFFNIGDYDTSGLLKDAADTIEQLAKKAKGYNTVYFTPIETEAYKKALEDIRADLKQSIQNGVIKIECGNEKLFDIIDHNDPLRAGKERE